MEVGQIAPDTFPNEAENHDPSPLRVHKSNRMKCETQTKMVSYDGTYQVKPLCDPRLSHV